MPLLASWKLWWNNKRNKSFCSDVIWIYFNVVLSQWKPSIKMPSDWLMSSSGTGENVLFFYNSLDILKMIKELKYILTYYHYSVRHIILWNESDMTEWHRKIQNLVLDVTINVTIYIVKRNTRTFYDELLIQKLEICFQTYDFRTYRISQLSFPLSCNPLNLLH